jgi:hypothetical protein
MLGIRLKRERRFTCAYGCCTKTNAHRRRITRNERTREKQAWRRDVEKS